MPYVFGGHGKHSGKHFLWYLWSSLVEVCFEHAMDRKGLSKLNKYKKNWTNADFVIFKAVTAFHSCNNLSNYRIWEVLLIFHPQSNPLVIRTFPLWFFFDYFLRIWIVSIICIRQCFNLQKFSFEIKYFKYNQRPTILYTFLFNFLVLWLMLTFYILDIALCTIKYVCEIS